MSISNFGCKKNIQRIFKFAPFFANSAVEKPLQFQANYFVLDFLKRFTLPSFFQETELSIENLYLKKK